MAELGIRDFEAFDFISSPEKNGIKSAIETLVMLDALNDDNTLTKIGEMMAAYPLLPRLSRMLVEAILKYPDVIEETIIAVTFLSTNSPFLLPQGMEMEARKAHHSFRSKYGDFISYIDIYDSFVNAEHKEEFCDSNFLDIKVMNEIVSIKEQLEDIVGEQGIPVTGGGSVENYLSAVAKGLIQFVCVRTGKGAYSSLTAERIFIHPGSVMFHENPDFIVAGEIVRTSRMYAHSVSPLNTEILKRISPELAAKLTSTIQKEAKGKDKADNAWQIKIGNQFFELKKGKGNKNKTAILQWDNLAKVIKSGSFVVDPQSKDLKCKVVWRDMEFLTNEKLRDVKRMIPYIHPDRKFAEELPFVGSISAGKHFDQLADCMNILLWLCPKKKNGKVLGFMTLHTDERGNYWVKSDRSFDNSVITTLGSLEMLMDQVPDKADPKSIKKVNATYRYFSEILKKY